MDMEKVILLLCIAFLLVTAEVMLFVLVGATVQVAIGGVPLAMGLSCGNMVLTVAVLAILITR